MSVRNSPHILPAYSNWDSVIWSIATSQGSEDALVRATELEPELDGGEMEIAEKVALEEVAAIYGTSESNTDEVPDLH